MITHGSNKEVLSHGGECTPLKLLEQRVDTLESTVKSTFSKIDTLADSVISLETTVKIMAGLFVTVIAPVMVTWIILTFN